MSTFSVLLLFASSSTAKMDALRDMGVRWSTYQRIDSSEQLIHKEQDDEPGRHAAAVIQSYRRLIALISSVAVLFFFCTIALLLALVSKKQTDQQCGAQTTLWCK